VFLAGRLLGCGAQWGPLNKSPLFFFTFSFGFLWAPCDGFCSYHFNVVCAINIGVESSPQSIGKKEECQVKSSEKLRNKDRVGLDRTNVRSNSFDRGRADEWREIQDRGAGKANIPRINIRPTPPPAALWIICLAVDVQYLRNFCVLEMQCWSRPAAAITLIWWGIIWKFSDRSASIWNLNHAFSFLVKSSTTVSTTNFREDMHDRVEQKDLLGRRRSLVYYVYRLRWGRDLDHKQQKRNQFQPGGSCDILKLSDHQSSESSMLWPAVSLSDNWQDHDEAACTFKWGWAGMMPYHTKHSWIGSLIRH
jgi:hypothetical protein